jgi:hypothetical protein
MYKPASVCPGGPAGDETVFLSEDPDRIRSPRSWRSDGGKSDEKGVFMRKTQISTPAQRQVAHTHFGGLTF